MSPDDEARKLEVARRLRRRHAKPALPKHEVELHVLQPVTESEARTIRGTVENCRVVRAGLDGRELVVQFEVTAATPEDAKRDARNVFQGFLTRKEGRFGARSAEGNLTGARDGKYGPGRWPPEGASGIHRRP